MKRRTCLAAAAALLMPAAHAGHGLLGPLSPPLPAPALDLLLHDGRRTTLRALLTGHLTAVQLMYTGCSSICPIQGALFAQLQSRLAVSLGQARLLSVSIDPLGDDARALTAWRARFGASSQWLAAAPPLKDADTLMDFVQGRATGPKARAERHNAQVFLFDADARLRFRCAELASAADVAALMVELARRPN